MFADTISCGRRLPCTSVTVVVLLKQNSRCLSAHLPSPLSLSTPHDSKFSKPAPLPGLHIDSLGLQTSLLDHTRWESFKCCFAPVVAHLNRAICLYAQYGWRFKTVVCCYRWVNMVSATCQYPPEVFLTSWNANEKKLPTILQPFPILTNIVFVSFSQVSCEISPTPQMGTVAVLKPEPILCIVEIYYYKWLILTKHVGTYPVNSHRATTQLQWLQHNPFFSPLTVLLLVLLL